VNVRLIMALNNFYTFRYNKGVNFEDYVLALFLDSQLAGDLRLIIECWPTLSIELRQPIVKNSAVRNV